jgi:hypothetical protein
LKLANTSPPIRSSHATVLSAKVQTISAKMLEALARTNYTTLVSVYDYVDAEEMRTYVAGNGDPGTEHGF